MHALGEHHHQVVTPAADEVREMARRLVTSLDRWLDWKLVRVPVPGLLVTGGGRWTVVTVAPESRSPRITNRRTAP